MPRAAIWVVLISLSWLGCGDGTPPSTALDGSPTDVIDDIADIGVDIKDSGFDVDVGTDVDSDRPDASGQDVGDVGWLDSPTTWIPLSFSPSFTGIQLSEGILSELQFPAPVWELCGSACESAFLTFTEFNTADVISVGQDADGYSVFVSVGHTSGPSGSRTIIERVLRLRDGVSVGAIRVSPPTNGVLNGTILDQLDSAMSVDVNDGDIPNILYILLDAASNRWEYKSPITSFSSTRDAYCSKFDLDISPPRLYFACGYAGGMMRMDLPGSNTLTFIPDTDGAMFGAGNFGLAVWVELALGGPVLTSRVRSESPRGEVQTLLDTTGAVCAVGVGQDRIVGFRGDGPPDTRACLQVSNPRLFYIPREGGAPIESPIIYADAVSIDLIRVWGNHAVAELAYFPEGETVADWALLLIRLSDWEMRLIKRPSRDYNFGISAYAVDEDYLYFSRVAPHHQVDKIFRYRLDQFDEIGERWSLPGVIPP